MTYLDHLKRKKYFLIGSVLVLFVILANPFPRGYVSVDGDVAQFIPTQENLSRDFNLSQGRTTFFYSIFYLLGKAGIPLNVQLSFYLAFFVFGSYLSFYFFSGIISKIKEPYRVLLSLIYAFNFFTLYCLQGVFGYSYYYFIYIFVPILFGLFFQFIKTGNRSTFFAFIAMVLLSSFGFGNPAYLLGLVILFFVLILSFLITGEISFSKKTLFRIGTVGLVSFLISSYWLLPLISQTAQGVANLEGTNPLKLNWWVYQSANPMEYTLGMLHKDSRDFPWTSPYDVESIFVLLAFIPIGSVLWVLSSKKMNNKKIIFGFLIALSIFVLLAVKTDVPFEKINYYIYNLWGFSTLRAYEKIVIFIPFLVLSVVMMTLESAKQNMRLVIAIGLALVVGLPFFTGDLHDGAKSKFLSKIPQEYYSIQSELNSDNDKVKIGVLPFNEDSGFGWSNYPKWDMHGADITLSLYDKEAINPNVAFFDNWMAAKDFGGLQQSDNSWMVKMLGLMNVKYIIYHKDVSREIRNLNDGKMDDLEKKEEIYKLNDNDYFTLYEIKTDYIFPRIFWEREDVALSANSQSIDDNFDEIKKVSSPAQFNEINHSKFVVIPEKNTSGRIILAEKYDPNWKAYAIDKSGKEIEIPEHFQALGYANGWDISKFKDAKEILIEYYPVRLFWKGMIISGLTAIFLIGYLIKHFYEVKIQTKKRA